MLAAAEAKGIVHAVTFNYRYNPLMQQARVMINRGDIGKTHWVHGYYIQDWLLYPNDYNWRLEKEGGESRCVADIGSHWCDLAGYITGSRIAEVLADYTTVFPTRQKPKGTREAFAQSSGNEEFDDYPVDTEDFASVLLRFENGMKGSFSVSQVSAGHKNGLEIEVDGGKAALAWKQERPNELWIGHRNRANELLLKDPSLLVPEARQFASYPGGHNEGFPDTFKQLYSEFYRVLQGGDLNASALFPTFADGHYELLLGEAILKSAKEERWVSLD